MEMKSSDRNNNFKNIIIKQTQPKPETQLIENDDKFNDIRYKYSNNEKINIIKLHSNTKGNNNDIRLNIMNDNLKTNNNDEIYTNANLNENSNANKKERKSYILESLNKLSDNDNDYYIKYKQILDNKNIEKVENRNIKGKF
jgi:hypothetical protein